jgi:hypothetical protein
MICSALQSSLLKPPVTEVITAERLETVMVRLSESPNRVNRDREKLLDNSETPVQITALFCGAFRFTFSVHA